MVEPDPPEKVFTIIESRHPAECNSSRSHGLFGSESVPRSAALSDHQSPVEFALEAIKELEKASPESHVAMTKERA